jgi:hypothetical protein
MEWTLHISYGLKPFNLKAVLEYESSQIMRIRVHGKKSTILLENNFPLLHGGKSKKGIKWQIREGKMDAGSAEISQLLMTIIEQLERYIKEEFAKRDKNRLFG